MKFCNNCKVKVNSDSRYCPLCGSFLEKQINDDYDNEYIQSFVKHPPLKVEGKTKHYLQKRLFWFALLVFVACTVINVITFDGIFWFGYVLFGLIACYYVISSSVFKIRRLYSLIGTTALVACFCVFGMEVTYSLSVAQNLSEVNVTVQYVIPAIVVGALVLTDIMIMLNKNKYKYFFISLIEITFVGVLLQSVVWLAKLQYAHNWFIFVAFFFSVINFILMIVMYWRTFKQEMLRKFNI